MDCESHKNKIKRDKLRQERLLPFGTFIEKTIEEISLVTNLQNFNDRKNEELVLVEETTNEENSSLTFEIKTDRKASASFILF